MSTLSFPIDQPPVHRAQPGPDGPPARPDEPLPGWHALLRNCGNLYALYQSPEWFDHLRRTEGEGRLRLRVARAAAGRVAGVVPLQLGTYDLAYEVKGRTLYTCRLPAAHVLGSLPLLPPDAHLHDELFLSLGGEAAGCEAVYLHSVPTDSFLWGHLQHSVGLREHYFCYLPGGVRPFHALELPGTYEAYLEKFPSKKRYNLKRQERLLRQHGGGRLDLQRVACVEQVPAFVAAVAQVARNSGRADALALVEDEARFGGKLADLAQRGLLRSYLLRCGGRACAFVLGYQYRDTYHYANVAYDQALKDFSPGTALLCLLIEDLIGHRPPRRVNFGIGHAHYKQEFGNVHTEDASVLLLRRTTVNRLRRDSHAAFRGLVEWLKRRLGPGA
jgi:CelD/BcsL family acetyltransferase involved in cellulose biosynthesis